MKKAKVILNGILQIIKLQEMRILPGQLAFFMVLTIFSILPDGIKISISTLKSTTATIFKMYPLIFPLHLGLKLKAQLLLKT